MRVVDLADAAHVTGEEVVVVDTDDAVEGGESPPFPFQFLVSGLGLSHSAGVLYVQFGEDIQIR